MREGGRGGERRGKRRRGWKKRKRGEGGRERARRDARRERGWAPQVEEEQSANDGGPREKRARELGERRKTCADG